MLNKKLPLLIITLFVILAGLTGNTSAADPVKYIMCDVRIAYFFDDATEIDWPTLYYLNDNYGCRIDLVRISDKSTFNIYTRSIESKQIYLHQLSVPYDEPERAKSGLDELFADRLPDIIISDQIDKNNRTKAAFEYFRLKENSTDLPFHVLKAYNRVTDTKRKLKKNEIVLNGKELLYKYQDRIKLEVPDLFPTFYFESIKLPDLTRYELTRDNLKEKAYENNFLSGITQFRLSEIIRSGFSDSPMRKTILDQIEKFKNYFNSALLTTGRLRVENVVKGFKEFRFLNQHERALSENRSFKAYLDDLFERIEKTTLDLVGIHWDGQIILRDSPHGPKLKYIADISVDGPLDVTLESIRFHPYFDSVSISLESDKKTILPHQSYIKEFLIDIDPAYLEGKIEDSLLFTTIVSYDQIPLIFQNSYPLWQSPDLQVNLEPDFYFIKPFPELDIDRVVSSLNMKVLINKPIDYSGNVGIKLSTPRGMFAGAYQQQVQLESGTPNETIRIPFTISNLFELGVQLQSIELVVDNQVVAADTGRIRIASCEISSKRTIGFLPDSSGLLEDILSMTDASFRPLTDRSLQRADLDAYDVIIIGYESFVNYPSFDKLKNRFEEYLRQGGSLVILGQPEFWPGNVLPVSFVPVVEAVDKNDITNRIPEANVLTKPYRISEKNLFSKFYKKQEVLPAVIAPSERVFVTPSGASLLSVSRLGEGQIIFCGLPLLELIARLDIEAIHLFANILNY